MRPRGLRRRKDAPRSPDRSRARRILELLAQGPRTATEIYREFPIAGPAVSRHLRVLREAGLVSDQPVPGDKRARLYRVDAEALAVLSSWLDSVSRGWQSQLDAFEGYVALRSGRREGQ